MELPRDLAERPATRTGLVLSLYGGLALVALLVSAGRDDVDIYRIAGRSTGFWLAVSPFVGLGVGLAVVAGSRWATGRYAWAQSLHRDFRSLLGPLTSREILILAAASSIGEELLFRGALMPLIGLWPQALLFALLHLGPARRFLPWTLSALVMGAVFGYLHQLTGDLGAPIAAHFCINYLNLHYIVRRDLDAPATVVAGGDDPLLSKAG